MRRELKASRRSGVPTRYNQSMCAACAMAAMAGASGVRSWLQTHHMGWLTPKRMRAMTLALFAVATLVASVGLSGSSRPPQPATNHTFARAP
jgi:hypothetical protein